MNKHLPWNTCEKHYQELSAVAASIARDADAGREALHTVFTRLDRREISNASELKKYIYRSVHNENHTQYRRWLSRMCDLSPRAAALLVDPSIRVDYEKVLAVVDKRSRRVLVLRSLEARDAEIAKITGVAVGHVAVIYSRAIDRIRERLGIKVAARRKEA